jgi:hypothetical protein
LLFLGSQLLGDPVVSARRNRTVIVASPIDEDARVWQYARSHFHRNADDLLSG